MHTPWRIDLWEVCAVAACGALLVASDLRYSEGFPRAHGRTIWKFVAHHHSDVLTSLREVLLPLPTRKVHRRCPVGQLPSKQQHDDQIKRGDDSKELPTTTPRPEGIFRHPAVNRFPPPEVSVILTVSCSTYEQGEELLLPTRGRGTACCPTIHC